MKDKMPAQITVNVHQNRESGTWELNKTKWVDGAETYDYVLRDNNPDYHVIKKSDVDVDVMGALDKVFHYLGYTSWNVSEDKHKDCFIALKTIRKAIIAQSDPDIVRIPRKVLEDMLKKTDEPQWDRHHNQAINAVLNYKEGE